MLIKIKKILKEHWMFFLILLAAFLIRVHKLYYVVPHAYDQEYVTNFVLDVVRVYPIKYVGQGLSIQGLFMGPFYFYFFVPFYLITNLHPIGGFVGSILFGMLIITVYYYCVSKIFGQRAGLIASFLRAFNYVSIEADWAMVPSASSDLSVILVWFCLYKIYKNKFNYIYLLALIFGLFSSFHVVQFPFYLIFLILIIIWKKRIPIKKYLLSFIIFMIPNIPIILFDYWRKWAMGKKILMMLTGKSSSGGQINIFSKLFTMITVVVNFLNSVISLKNKFLLINFLIFGVFIYYLTFYLKKKYKKNLGFHLPIFYITLVVFILYYTLFPSHVPEYYLQATAVMFIIYLSFLISQLFKHKIARYFLTGYAIYYLIVCIFLTNKQWSHPKLRTLGHKEFIVDKIVEDAKDKNDFAISYITTPGWSFGFESLFRLKNKEPTGKGSVYTIVSPIDKLKPSEIDVVSGNVGLVYPKN